MNDGKTDFLAENFLLVPTSVYTSWVNAISAPKVLLHVNYTEMYNLTYTILILYCTELPLFISP